MVWLRVVFGSVVHCIGGYQRQAFDAQVVSDNFFESKLDLLKITLQEYREAFRRCAIVGRDQGWFFCGQGLDFLYRLLRRIVVRDDLPEKTEWDNLLSFDFHNCPAFIGITGYAEEWVSNQGDEGCEGPD